MLITSGAQVCFPLAEPHHPPISCHAVAAAHVEELEGITTRISNHAQALEREKKGKLPTDVSTGLISSQRKKELDFEMIKKIDKPLARLRKKEYSNK